MKSKDKKAALITATTPEGQRLETERQQIAQVLTELVEEIFDLQSQLRQGDPKNKAEAGKLLSDLRYWLKAARETEAELEKIRRKEAGIEEVWGLDLQAAELEIGCRLARLRPCCDAQEIPE